MATSGAPRERTVLYASERRYRSRFKMWMWEDRGRLEFRSGSILFTSHRRTVGIPAGARLDLVPTLLPWGNMAITLLASILILGFLFGPAALLAAAPAFIGSLAGMLIGLFIAGKQRWVRVDFFETDGTPRRAYFTMGRAWGWSALLGSERLLAQIRDALSAAPRRPGFPTFSPAGGRRDL